jgi:cytochrome c oxidase subunit 3
VEPFYPVYAWPSDAREESFSHHGDHGDDRPAGPPRVVRTEATAPRGRAVPAQAHSSPPLLVVGIIIFLGSELMFFAALFGMYFTLRGQTAPWPPPGTDIEFLRPFVFTVDLVASSFTMQMAVVRIRQGNVTSMKRWILLTFAMGWIFLAGQFWDYLGFDFNIGTNAYGSAFYTMTGFHALHVFAGLLAMLVVLGRAAARAVSEHEHAGLEGVAYYWHFVDVVWIALFVTLFVIK